MRLFVFALSAALACAAPAFAAFIHPADTNKDGKITLAEAEAAAVQHFDMADSNHDGKITRDERRQMHQRMRAEHQQTRG